MTTAQSTDLEAALRRDLDGDVAFDAYSRRLFARDASMYAIEPLGVAFPRHAGDVAAAVAIAREAGVPIVARGGGTSLAGQTVGPGLVLDLSRYMRTIVSLDPEARRAVVEPGVVQDQLNRAAARHGLMFGPDTSTSNRATLGGMIGNNSAGSGSIRYGMTIDHVRALDAVLADGSTVRLGPVDPAERERRAAGSGLEARLYRELPELVRAHRAAIDAGFPPHWRRAGGYRLDRLAANLDAGTFDLAKFVVGGEGTLLVATRAVVDLVPKPAHTVIAVGHFTSAEAAIEATGDALSFDPAGVELMDRTILDLSRQRIEYADLGRILAGDPDALLFVSFSGDDRADLEARLDGLIALWKKNGHGYHTLRAATPEQQGALLKVRKNSLGLLMAAGVRQKRPLAFVEDTAVPPDKLAPYTTRFREVLDRHGMTAGFYGHCSVGCLHIRPFVDLSKPGEAERMRAVAEEIRDLAAEYGGVNSSEHGDGLARSEFNRTLFGDELYEAMRRVKAIFDPDGVLNPGKIVDSPSMTENLRDAALPPAPSLRTRLTFAEWGSPRTKSGGAMRDAADRCMNIGLCRKADQGVMCPSYMATRNEEDSTRGRANALVAALSEPDPRTALGDDRLHEVLDLCLMCKACKSECPLGVDMAALKSEALHQRHATRGTPLRSRAFGAIRTLNRLGAATAPLSNLPIRLGPVRKLMESALGITARRPLPRFAPRDLVRWDRRRSRTPGPLGTVVFLADSFTTYTEPGVGRAAIDLLERAGWSVRLESRGCCGRAKMSKGLLDGAAAEAKALATRLAEVQPGAPITGVEPSCLFMLTAEHGALLPGAQAVRDVAGRVRTIEDLLVEAVDAGRLKLRDDRAPAGRRILFHGHCHQKAEVGTAATVALLRRVPGAEVTELDAGCCGMAGSFGFEAEHYEVSRTVGEDRLFPAVRAEPSGTVIAATGVSCRQQIRHGTDRTARHPVEIIRALVD